MAQRHRRQGAIDVGAHPRRCARGGARRRGARGCPSAAPHHHQKRFVSAQLLSINDFHGNIEANTPGTIREDTPAGPAIPAGGAEYLATYVRNLRAQNPRNTLVVSAGDLIGASPLALGAVPRRADDRGDEQDRPRPQRGRQPRVRRGHGRAPAHAVRRLPSVDGARLPATATGPLPRRALPVPGGQRRAGVHGPPAVRALRDPAHRRRQGRLHRHDARGHARHRRRRPASRASSSSTRPIPRTAMPRSCAAQASRRS